MTSTKQKKSPAGGQPRRTGNHSPSSVAAAYQQTSQLDNDGGPRWCTLPHSYVASCTCNDCGTNVVKAGHYVMLVPQIWYGEFGLGWDDNLCLGCIEMRLGRRLSMARGDFMLVPPLIKGYPPSDELLKRFGYKPKGGVS